MDEKPDVVINIVDATNIERNLYLTTQLIELGILVIVALNMMNSVQNQGDSIDITEFGKALGVAVLPTSANKGKGIHEVMERAVKIAQGAAASGVKNSLRIYDESVEKSIEKVERIIEASSSKRDYNPRLPAVKLLEDDEREMNSWKWTLFAVGYQAGVAWIVAFLIFQLRTLLGLK